MNSLIETSSSLDTSATEQNSKGLPTGNAGVGRTLQDYANEILAPEFRQPLMTARQACWANGWAFDEKPVCCGKECERRGFIGGAYHVECESCGRFIADVTGPSFSNGGGCVYLIDTEKFPADTDWGVCWIAGRTPTTQVGTPATETRLTE